jgi:hypothetical protein
VTQRDVLAAARTHLHPEALQILAVGDAAAITEPLAALQLGTPSVTTADEGESA